MLIAQITDLHVMPPGPNHLGIDTAAMLAAAVARLNALVPRPDAVLITGDLTDLGSAAEYAEVRRQLAPLQAPCYVIPGNHDDRDAFRMAFADHAYLPSDGEFLQFSVDLGPIRLIGLDTVIPGSAAGTLCAERLSWLADALDATSGKPVLIAMHHPPMDTAIPFMDRIGLRGREAFADVIARHPTIERITCGHVHRPIMARFAGTVASTCPSTAHQVLFTLSHTMPDSWSPEPPGFQVHLWTPTAGLVTHTLPIRQEEIREFTD